MPIEVLPAVVTTAPWNYNPGARQGPGAGAGEGAVGGSGGQPGSACPATFSTGRILLRALASPTFFGSGDLGFRNHSARPWDGASRHRQQRDSVYGATMNKDHRPVTIGNVQIYPYADLPSAYHASYTHAIVNTGLHEEGHTMQFESLWENYLPYQALGFTMGDNNPFDIDADGCALRAQACGR